MNKIISFLRLIRFTNILFIIAIQVLIKYFLINSYLENFSLSNLNFSIYLLALVSIVAGGYIINDIYDIEIDKINKPNRRIVEKEISKGSAIKMYYSLNFLGISSGFYSALQVNKLWLVFIFIFFCLSLWKYSKDYKRKFLTGNLQVAFLTALSIINIALFDIVPLVVKNENGSIIILYIIIIYAGFSFVTTLIREIIKDLEDHEGDEKMGANTLAIHYGIRRTKNIVAFLILIPIIGIGRFQYFQYSVLKSSFSVELNYWGVNIGSVAYTLFLQILLIVLLINIQKSSTKLNFYQSSSLCKIIMISGILSIPLFNLLFQAK